MNSDSGVLQQSHTGGTEALKGAYCILVRLAAQ